MSNVARKLAPQKLKPAKTGNAGDPLLTQENFEKELKALASKAQEETWTKWTREQVWILIQSATLLTFAAIYSNVSQLTLSPIYGSIPSSVLHSKGVMTACFMGWSCNLFLRRRLPVKPVHLLPLISAYIPVAHFFLFKVSGLLGAIYGPIIIESVTFLPLLMLSVSCTATVLDDLEMSPGRLRWLADATPGISSYAFYKTMEYFLNGYISSTINSTIIHTRVGLSLLLTGLYTVFAPSKFMLYAIPAIIHTAIFNTHLPTPYATSAINASMQKSGWSLLDRRESLTGYISIIESAGDGFRVMRCDHSLLGGEWLGTKSQEGVSEPIYGVFIMLEAVRLVKVEQEASDKELSALVIGLGIGTTPAAFIKHGITTTIVEIDPTVHEFALKYFDLPSLHTPVIEDAVSYASETAKSGKKFDYIVHDVFTGGAEPVDLFTEEFVRDLSDMLEDWGAIAINYAGDLTLPPSRIITQTIKSIFPTCRVYRESAAPSDQKIKDEGHGDFTNMVIFCTKQVGGDISFRSPMNEDFLGSRARKKLLIPKHEVLDSDFAEIEDGEISILRKNNTNRFEKWHQKSSRGHWAVMRTVLPENIWEQW